MTHPALALHIGGHWLRQASGGERPVVNSADGTNAALQVFDRWVAEVHVTATVSPEREA